MGALDMKALLKKNEQRQLDLIDILYARTQAISISEVANKLGYSERTIALDIRALQEKFPFLILKVNNQSITMAIEPHYNISYVYQYMFQCNTGVQLLERLFLYKQTHLKDLLTLLELSQATVYRLIEQVNEQITHNYEVKIDTNPFQLKGDEDKIRGLFSQLYSDIYTPLEWPFINIDEAAIADLIIIVTDAIHYPLNYIGINYMKFLVAVNLVRLRQGHDVEIESEKAAYIYKTLQSTPFMSDQTKQTMKRLGVPLNQHTVNQLFHVFINSDYIFPNSKIINFSKDIDKRIESFNHFNYIVETLKKEFDLTFDNPGPLILNLHNAAILNHLDIDSGNILLDSKTKFIEDLSRRFPDFISRASQLFQEYCMKMGSKWDRFLNDRLIHHLFIQWETLYTQLVKNKRIIEVIIVCNYEPNHAFFLKEYFELHFGKKVRFNIYNDSQISITQLKKVSEPIILSTFHIPFIEGKYIININFFPSEDDLEKVYNVLKKMRAMSKTIE